MMSLGTAYSKRRNRRFWATIIIAAVVVTVIVVEFGILHGSRPSKNLLVEPMSMQHTVSAPDPATAPGPAAIAFLVPGR